MRSCCSSMQCMLRGLATGATPASMYACLSCSAARRSLGAGKSRLLVTLCAGCTSLDACVCCMHSSYLLLTRRPSHEIGTQAHEKHARPVHYPHAVIAAQQTSRHKQTGLAVSQQKVLDNGHGP